MTAPVITNAPYDVLATEEERRAKWESETVGAVVMGHDVTIAELRVAFDLVTRGMANWKVAIDTVIPFRMLLAITVPMTATNHREYREMVIDQAVRFFAGSAPTFERLRNSKLRVRAAGYYADVGT